MWISGHSSPGSLRFMRDDSLRSDPSCNRAQITQTNVHLPWTGKVCRSESHSCVDSFSVSDKEKAGKKADA